VVGKCEGYGGWITIMGFEVCNIMGDYIMNETNSGTKWSGSPTFMGGVK